MQSTVLFYYRESRYLLVLTENYAALRLLQGQLHDHDPVIIFGSSFPKDQQYTQVYFQFLFICILLPDFKYPTFNNNNLLTESEGSTGKYPTEVLLY
jgi:hypothetical protein